MKLLVLTSDLHTFGGIQQHTAMFLRALRDAKVDYRHLELRGKGLGAKGAFVFKSIVALMQYRPDFILANHINYAPLARVLSMLGRVRYGVVVYGIEAWAVSGARLKALRSARAVVAVSQHTKRVMEENGFAVPGQFHIVTSAIDAADFAIREKPAYLVERHGLKGKKVILTLCRLSALEQYKGHDRVIRALPAVLEQVPEAVYVIAGDGNDKPRLERLARDQGVGESVVFTKVSHNEKTDYYNLADVFVMPSTGEGFGIVFLEAMACGVPVIAGNRDASPEPLLHGDLGTLIDPLSISEIASALVRVLKKEARPELLDRDRLRAQVIERFGYPAIQGQVNDFLKTIGYEL